MNENLGQLMEQAKKLQQDMEKAQKDLESTLVTGEAGGGLVKVTTNCRHQAPKVEISEDAYDEGRKVLEDLLCAAINDLVNKIEKRSKAKMANLASGIQLPNEVKFGKFAEPEDDE